MVAGLKRPAGPWEADGVPLRSIMQFVLALPSMAQVPTVLAAVMLIASSVANFVGHVTGEEGDMTRKTQHKKKQEKRAKEGSDPMGYGELEKLGCCARIRHMIGRLKEMDYLGQAIFSFVYWAINVTLFVTYWVVNKDTADTLSGWVPPAKARDL